MTNKQYFISLLGFAPSAELVEGALTDVDLILAETYIKENSLILKKAVIFAIDVLLTTPDTRHGSDETRNELTFDRDAILKRRAILVEEIGESTGRPTIKAISPW